MSIINKKITNVPIAQFETNIAAPLASLTLPLSPVQSFNGYDGPWPGGARKNKLPIAASMSPTTAVGATWTPAENGWVTVTGTPTSTSNRNYNHVVLPAGTYVVSGIPESAPTSANTAAFVLSKNQYGSAGAIASGRSDRDREVTFTIEEETDVYLRLYVYAAAGTITDYVFKPMVRLVTESADWEPYENICPISGWTGANVTVSPTTTGGTVYPVTWSEAGTVYGGEVDIVSGVLTVTHEAKTVGQLTSGWSDSMGNMIYYVSITAKAKGMLNVISDRYFTPPTKTRPVGSITGSDSTKAVYFATSYPDLATFRQEEANTMFVYPLETPQTYQLTPTQVLTLLGVNNVWSDTGNITLEYPFRVFDILRVTINGTDITDYIAFQGLKRGRNDVESPNAGRTLDAVMHRGRVATKLRWDVTCRPLTSQELSILENLIMPETVNVTIEGDPYYDTWTRRCYVNNTSASYLILKPDGRQLWGGITFPIIEV